MQLSWAKPGKTREGGVKAGKNRGEREERGSGRESGYPASILYCVNMLL